MRPKLLVASVVLSMLGVSACGGSSSSSSSAGSGVPATKTKSTGPLVIYRVALSGSAETPAGAPAGVGDAVIAFHGSSVVCWRFAHLHGFTSATFAHIHSGAKGKSGKIVVPLSTGSALHHRGCVPVSPTLTKAIERHPSDYYVNVHSVKYPAGAVRAQL